MTGADTALLLHQCITPASPSGEATLRATATAFTDWDALFALAAAHRMLPLVARRLSALGTSSVPDAVRAHLLHLYQTHAARQARLQVALHGVLDILGRADIRALPLRGPILGAQLYDDPTCRQADDLDLLVPRDELFRCRALLEDEGYARLQPAPRGADRQIRWSGGACVLQKPGDTFQVDLVWSLTPRYFARPLTLTHLWPHTSQQAVMGRPVPILDPTTLLLTLCVHGTKHLWSRHAWTADVAALLGREAIDWPALFALAGAHGMQRMLLAGLAWTTRLTGLHLPTQVAAQLQSVPGIQRWCLDLETQFNTDPAWVPRDNRERARLQLAVQSDTRDRLRYIAMRGLLPSANDWRMLKLPPVLYPLYFLTRPLRLAGRALTNGFNGNRRSGNGSHHSTHHHIS